MIMQGDDGTRLKLHIRENNVPVDLSGATIEVKIKAGMRNINKTAYITNTGEAEIELNSDDLATAGIYYTQVTVVYSDENQFNSDIQTFRVGKNL